MIVLVGSTRPAKVEAVRAALEAIAAVDARFAPFTLESHDVTDVAPRMPMTLAAIIDGAHARATALHPRFRAPRAPAPPHLPSAPPHLPSAPPHLRTPAPVSGAPSPPPPNTFAVGLEGGLVQLPRGQWSLQSWSAVTDGSAWGYGAGPSLVLPDRVAARVVAGEELGDVIDDLAGASVRGTRGAWGILTLDLIGRRDAFRAAVIAAFAPFYNRGAWTGRGAHELGLDPRPH